jgi:hypothetical protein
VTTAVNDKQDADGRQVFRSVGAAVVWWIWVLFAAGNLIDLAVQGRDHLSLVAAFILVFATGIMYITALRPRIVLDDDGLTITNPFRAHRVGWATVAGADPTDLLRVRCEWPQGRRAIYCWAVHSSRRRQVAAEMRARRQTRQGSRAGLGAAGGFGAFGLGGAGLGGGFGSSEPSPEGDPLRLDPNRVVATLTERAEQARQDAPDSQAAAPVSTWDLVAVAAVVIPGLALLITALA